MTYFTPNAFHGFSLGTFVTGKVHFYISASVCRHQNNGEISFYRFENKRVSRGCKWSYRQRNADEHISMAGRSEMAVNIFKFTERS